MVHTGPPTLLNQGRRYMRSKMPPLPQERQGLDDFFMVCTYTSGARIQSTPSLQALAGVRVLASLLAC